MIPGCFEFLGLNEPPRDADLNVVPIIKLEPKEELPLLDSQGQPLEKSSISRKKNKEKNERTYLDFIEWLMSSTHSTICEESLIEYFTNKARVAKASTLWASYYMIKSIMLNRHSIDIGNFKKVHKLLREKSKGYVADRAKAFTKEEVHKFLKLAPDEDYLLYKVALILGVCGGCRRDELAKLTVEDIQDLGAVLLVKISDPKSNLYRTFTVDSAHPEVLDCREIVRKYINLRPVVMKRHNRFFVTYSDGVCGISVVGTNTIAKIPSLVARFLKLPEPEKFNAHSFRSTKALLEKTDQFF
ncbi:uncharacterized protein LOC126747732 [Anthonomus grandis grandis]|uniref:uncharacterized protein LOC126747732 n=1 Tax=Anthonomus grandis grandis TaxID=2921223 RepID=UPI002165BDFB|nr:uncharacterized protein LOC126747732 [Anthonomus grandis grandis]